MNQTALQQIRAVYDDKTIRVYQAYSDAIADSALTRGTFVSPPFKMERMTWIKPSFLWMMYRAGWGFKDEGQKKRILAIDITREGFEWALAHSCSSHSEPNMSHEEWKQLKKPLPGTCSVGPRAQSTTATTAVSRHPDRPQPRGRPFIYRRMDSADY
nr:hypothetical protein GCM10020185_83190 [Pseudomonas brassicacearum subsp. brassicacearum]